MHLLINVAFCILLFNARCCVTSPISDSNPLFENLRNQGKLENKDLEINERYIKNATHYSIWVDNETFIVF